MLSWLGWLVCRTSRLTAAGPSSEANSLSHPPGAWRGEKPASASGDACQLLANEATVIAVALVEQADQQASCLLDLAAVDAGECFVEPLAQISLDSRDGGGA